MEPIAVQFPLIGEWCAVNTPGHQVPSHGTDLLGQRYAYDFVQIDWSKEGYTFHKVSTLRSLMSGIPLRDTFGWSQPIYAPFDGEVIEARDGLEERDPIHPVREFLIVLKNSFFLRAQNNRELHPVLGNYIILKRDDGVYALIAHARDGSIGVSKGQKVTEGQELAQVGHSGNSTAPHLHFQLMDRPDLLDAQGLPCCFKSYRLYEQGDWKPVVNGIPGKRERLIAGPEGLIFSG